MSKTSGRRRRKSGFTAFQTNLESVRVERKLTLRQLADLAQLPHSTVFGWVNGASPYEIDAIYRLSKALKVDFQWLMVGQKAIHDSSGLDLEDFFEEDPGNEFEGIYRIRATKMVPKGTSLPRKRKI